MSGKGKASTAIVLSGGILGLLGTLVSKDPTWLTKLAPYFVLGCAMGWWVHPIFVPHSHKYWKSAFDRIGHRIATTIGWGGVISFLGYLLIEKLQA